MIVGIILIMLLMVVGIMLIMLLMIVGIMLWMSDGIMLIVVILIIVPIGVFVPRVFFVEHQLVLRRSDSKITIACYFRVYFRLQIICVFF